jgi:hypothetical protein
VLSGNLVCLHLVGVHRGHARVGMLGNIVRVLGHARRSVEHVSTWVLLLRLVYGLTVVLVRSSCGDAVAMAILRLGVVAVHVLAKVGEGRSSMDGVTLDARMAGHADLGPVNSRHSGCRWRLAAVRVGCAVVQL